MTALAQTEAPVAALRVRDDLAGLDVAKLSDAELPMLRSMLLDDIAEYKDPRVLLIAQCEAVMRKRMLERGAHALPSSTHIVALEDQYTPYAYDLEGLKKAAAMLPDDEAAKVVKHVPELTTTVPAHDEPGMTVSIAALIKKYGVDDDGNPTSDVGKALAASMKRDPLDPKLVVKPRPQPMKRVS